jgi:molybdopterin molybdotransferase
VIVSGGSSVGIEDLAPMLLAKHGELAVHGIAMRPSSPTGMGTLGSRLVFLLPGNPVSALCAYDFFAGRAIRALGGRSKEWPYRAVRGTLTRKISSPIGRLDYARVKVAPRLRWGQGCASSCCLSRARRCSPPPRGQTAS